MSVLSEFWNDKDVWEPGTYIAKKDYSVLQSKLISKEQWMALTEKQRCHSPYNTMFHSQLHAEPFVGNLDAPVYIITLNPAVADDEYTNWQNQTLKDMADNCLVQGKTEYPFYYLDPKLLGTGGSRYWIEKVDKLPNGKRQSRMHHKFYKLANELESRFNSRDEAIKKIAQNVCDLEFCPYHSKNWAGDKLVRSLPSVQAMIDFLRTVVVPGVIDGSKSLVVGRGVTEINKVLNGVTFDFNGKQIDFNALDNGNFADNVVFYRKPEDAQQMLFEPGSLGGDLLLRKLK